MSRRPEYRTRNATGVTVGWLFADLLLALGMLFLISSTVGVPPPPVTPTVTPRPTPTPDVRILEHSYCEIILTISDLPKFQADQRSAMDQLEPQIDRIAFLKGRQVGIAIASGGIQDDSNMARGQQVASTTYQVLANLGKRSKVFAGTSYFNPLFTYNYNSKQVQVDLYLVVRASTIQETCNTSHNVI